LSDIMMSFLKIGEESKEAPIRNRDSSFIFQ